MPAVPPAAPPPLAPTDMAAPLPTARAITPATAIVKRAAECVTGLPPPIQVIRSLTVIDTMDVNALQMDVAQRTLPQHQTASQTVPPSANAKGKCKARAASINPQKSCIEVDTMIAPNVVSTSYHSWPFSLWLSQSFRENWIMRTTYGVTIS